MAAFLHMYSYNQQFVDNLIRLQETTNYNYFLSIGETYEEQSDIVKDVFFAFWSISMKYISRFVALVCIFFLMSCMALNREYKDALNKEKMGQYLEAYESYCALLEISHNSSVLINAKDRSKDLASLQLYKLYLQTEMNNLAECYRGSDYLHRACSINPDNTNYLQAYSDHQLFTEEFRLKVQNDLKSINAMVENKQFQKAITLAASVLSRDTQFEYTTYNLMLNIKESAGNHFLQLAKNKVNDNQWDDAFGFINQALSFYETKEAKDYKGLIIKKATDEGFERADHKFTSQKFQEALDELEDLKQFGDARLTQKRDSMISDIHEHCLAKMNTLLMQKKWRSAENEINLAETFGTNEKTKAAKKRLIDSEKAWGLYKSSQGLIQNNKLEEAVIKMEEACELCSEFQELRPYLADCYYSVLQEYDANNDYYKVLSTADKLLTLNTNNINSDLITHIRVKHYKELLSKYSSIYNLFLDNKLYGHAMLIGQLKTDLGDTNFNTELNRITEIVRSNSIQQFAVIPFQNYQYNLDYDYGNIVSNRIREAIEAKPVLRQYLGFVNREQIDIIAKEYRHRIDGLMREQDGFNEGEMIGADYLIVGSINKFNVIDVKYDDEYKEKEYVTSTQQLPNPKWNEWAQQKHTQDKTMSETDGFWNKVLVGVLTAPGDEPSKYIIHENKAMFYYTIEKWKREGEIELTWRLIDMRTSKEINKGTKAFTTRQNDTKHAGLSLAGIHEKKLNFKNERDVREALLARAIDEVMNSISKDLENLPSQMFITAEEYERQNLKHKALELTAQAQMLQPNNVKFTLKLNDFKESLKITNPKRYLDHQAYLKSITNIGKKTDNQLISISDEEKKLYDTILQYALEQEYNMAKGMIKLFMERYP
ncbi:MAG: hypothetical protein GX294_02770, partial [Candidatus Cloacimonetes bacterium]|nr:hypothetical protein [Candidatus Cloacimonadota bacterium]